jgi:hypothetical protein
VKAFIRTTSIFAICLQLLAGASAIAHPGHEHVLTEKLAILRGKAVVSSLIRKEEPVNGEILDESWQRVTDSAACRETPEYYLIAFDNRQAGKTLYILLTSAGKYLRANFDGQFADLIFSPYPVQSCS